MLVGRVILDHRTHLTSFMRAPQNMALFHHQKLRFWFTLRIVNLPSILFASTKVGPACSERVGLKYVHHSGISFMSGPQARYLSVTSPERRGAITYRHCHSKEFSVSSLLKTVSPSDDSHTYLDPRL